MKTLGIRVKAQQRNAKRLAKYLEKHAAIKTVYYPGLKSSEYHSLAKIQMKGYGAMLSFELKDRFDSEKFLKALTLIKPSMSLAGVESTMLLPSKTSHSLLSESDQAAQGITDQLIRFSVGIETAKDLIKDIEQAISASNLKK